MIRTYRCTYRRILRLPYRPICSHAVHGIQGAPKSYTVVFVTTSLKYWQLYETFNNMALYFPQSIHWQFHHISKSLWNINVGMNLPRNSGDLAKRTFVSFVCFWSLIRSADMFLHNVGLMVGIGQNNPGHWSKICKRLLGSSPEVSRFVPDTDRYACFLENIIKLFRTFRDNLHTYTTYRTTPLPCNSEVKKLMVRFCFTYRLIILRSLCHLECAFYAD